MFRDKSNVLFLLPLYALVAVVIYWPAQTGGWFFDDLPAIVSNPALKNLDMAWAQLTQPRGVVYLTFALDRYFWGVDPAAARWTNVALHVATTLLAVQLLRQLTGARGWKVILFGLLFLCHPLQSSAVSYIVQRMAVLSAFFALASILCVDRFFLLTAAARSRAAALSLVAAVIFFILACMSKENAVLLPVVVFALAWLRGGATLAPGWRQALCILSLIPAAAVAVRWSLTRSVAQLFHSAFSPLTDNGGTYYVKLQDLSLLPWRYFLSQLDAFWVYLGLLILPLRQALDYSRPIPPAVPSVVQVGTALLLVLLGYWAIRQRSRYPLTVFGLVWIFTFMAVESSFIPLDPIFEHRLYLPFIGWGLILYEQSGRLPLRTCQGCFLLLIGVYAGLTMQRNVQWGDAVSLAQSDVVASPRSARPVFHLAEELFAAGRYAEVAEVLAPFKGFDESFIRQRMGEALHFAGRQAEAFAAFRRAQLLDETLAGFDSFYAAHSAILASDYDRAEGLLALAETNDARSVFGLYLRGLLSEGRGDPLRAVEFYQKSISVAEKWNYRKDRFSFDVSYGDWAHTRRSQLLERLSGRLAAEKAEVARAPNDVVRRVNWANRLSTLGLYEEAISEYRAVTQMAPGVWQAHYNLGLAYEKVARPALAESSYRATLQLVPDNTEVQFNYVLLLKNRDARQAQNILEQLLTQRPGDGRIWLAYGEVLKNLGDKDRALRAYDQAALLPGYKAVAKRLSSELSSEAK